MDAKKASIEQDENPAPNALKPSASNPTPEEWAQHFTSRDEAWHKDFDKSLLVKVDRRLMPTLVMMYLLNFLDRSNLAQARQGTLEADLGMSGTDFNLATSIFFVGYLLMQLPSNLLLTRFLGFVEAPFFPGAVFLMSSWYTRAELTRRIAYLYAGNALANMFGGLLGAAILGNLEGDLGHAGWRWLFIIVRLSHSIFLAVEIDRHLKQEGVVAIAFALVAMWILPDYPHTTKWLSEEERAYAAWRLIEDIQEADTYHEQSMWGGVKMAVRDYRLYIFILMQHLSLVTQTFQYFFPTIVGTLGYGKINTLWLTAPCWAATFLISVCVTYSSSKTKDRSLHILCLTLLSGVGNAIATGSSVVGVRYFAMFLMPMGAISACELHQQHIA
ncbi:MFS transporter prlL [Colletotrichum sp. SAR11_59]|nr:MFS transporter prlL [Colletotrichum sp. SAR11_59]